MNESLLNTMTFSLPHRRWRWYAVFMDRDQNHPVAASVGSNSFLTMLQNFTCSPLPFSWFLTETSVQPMMQSLRKSAGNWKRVHAAFMRKHSLSPVSVQALVDSPSFCSAVKSARVRHSLACWHVLCASRNIDFAHARVVMQVDQSLDRMPMSPLKGEPFLPCATSHGSYWYPPLQRCLSSTELLSLQGLSPQEQERLGLHLVPSAMRRNLAGNAFSVPVATAVCIAAILTS